MKAILTSRRGAMLGTVSLGAMAVGLVACSPPALTATQQAAQVAANIAAAINADAPAIVAVDSKLTPAQVAQVEKALSDAAAVAKGGSAVVSGMTAVTASSIISAVLSLASVVLPLLPGGSAVALAIVAAQVVVPGIEAAFGLSGATAGIAPASPAAILAAQQTLATLAAAAR